MRVIEVDRFGGPEVLRLVERDDPSPGPGEVLVRVEAADVLFVEAVIRYGLAVDYFPFRPPYVPGGGVAGTVAAVGTGVARTWLGRRVGTRVDGGGYAELAVASAEALVPIPDSLDFDVAASLLHDGPTALALTDAARISAGDQVLITAAAGAMGLLLVQLAVATGASVIGAARGEPKLELIRSFGARPVDYSADGWIDLVGRPDVVLDGAGTTIGRAAFEAVADGGRFSAHGSPSGGFADIDPAEAERRGVTFAGIDRVQFEPAQVRELVDRSYAAAVKGDLHPVIGERFPLADAARAHTALEERALLGKALLLP